VKRFRGGLVVKAHRLLRLIDFFKDHRKKKKKKGWYHELLDVGAEVRGEPLLRRALQHLLQCWGLSF